MRRERFWERARAWAITLVVVGLTVAGVAAIHWDRGPSTDPGDVVVGDLGVPESPEDSSTWTVPLPSGAIEATVTASRELRVGSETHHIDGPARWVEVSWQPPLGGAEPGAVWPGSKVTERREPPAQLVLIADGDRYVVAGEVLSSSGPGAVTIAVAGARDLRLVAVSQGREMAVDGRGVRQGPRTHRTCREAKDVGFEARVDCVLEVKRLAYVAGLGWAPKGKDWIVVEQASVSSETRWPGQVYVGRWSARGERGAYSYVSSGEPSLTLEVSGVGKPARTAGRGEPIALEPSLPVQAYTVPSGERVTVRMTYRTPAVQAPGRRPAPEAPARLTAQAVTEVTV